MAEEEDFLGSVWDLVKASLPQGAASWDRHCACEGSISDADSSPKHTLLVSLLLCLDPDVVLAGSQVGPSSSEASSPTQALMGWIDI